MTSSITAIAAREHAADLRRTAERGRRTARRTASTWVQAKLPTVELRLAHAGETRVIARLAALDDAPELEGQVLLALIDGQAQAGLSLSDGRVIANPFVRTADAVALLRVRAELLSAHDHAHGHRLPRILSRFAPRLRSDREQARVGS